MMNCSYAYLEQLKQVLLDRSMRISTLKVYASLLYDAAEAIDELLREVRSLRGEKRKTPRETEASEGRKENNTRIS